jgi:hypothetical protein
MTTDERKNQEQSRISPMQAEAWALWNESYHVLDGEAYRSWARELYQRDLHQQVRNLFTELDEQNERLDALLNNRRSGSREAEACSQTTPWDPPTAA